jgi:AraC-like DNA-binding protein
MNDSVRYLRFPIRGVDAMSACTMRSYPRHSHDQYGIGVVDCGGHSSWSGRGQVEAGPGGLICCNPGEATDGRAIGGRPRAWRMLYLEPALMEALCADARDHAALDTGFMFAAPVFSSARTRELFDRAFAHAHALVEVRDPMRAETALVRLVAQLHAHSTIGRLETGGPVGSIRRVKNRIDADPAAQLTLAALATEAGLSRFQLLRAFARECDLTPHAYILQRRIQLARQLIRTGRSLAEVAALSGFYDQPHLTRCFVRQFGVTPRRYRSCVS